MQLFKVDKQFKISNDWEKAGIEQLTVMSGQSFQGCGEQNNWGRERRRERRTGQDLLKTLLSSQRCFLLKKDQGHFTVERMMLRGNTCTLRSTEIRAPGSMPKRGESGSTNGVYGCKGAYVEGIEEKG